MRLAALLAPIAGSDSGTIAEQARRIESAGFDGTWGRNVARAASEFDGWLASGMHRSPEQCADAIRDYRAAGGGRALVSTIRVTRETDMGELRERLGAFATAGFDDAIVMILPGGPSLEDVRALV